VDTLFRQHFESGGSKLEGGIILSVYSYLDRMIHTSNCKLVEHDSIIYKRIEQFINMAIEKSHVFVKYLIL
jgi:hypothetical protein